MASVLQTFGLACIRVASTLYYVAKFKMIKKNRDTIICGTNHRVRCLSDVSLPNILLCYYSGTPCDFDLQRLYSYRIQPENEPLSWKFTVYFLQGNYSVKSTNRITSKWYHVIYALVAHTSRIFYWLGYCIMPKRFRSIKWTSYFSRKLTFVAP